MEAVYKPGIVFRFRRSKNTAGRQPSRALAEALRHLAESEEMQPLIDDALARRRDVVVEVFHSSDGHPLLIHTTTAPKREAHGGTGAGAGTMPPL
jgi:hypothetical protein